MFLHVMLILLLVLSIKRLKMAQDQPYFDTVWLPGASLPVAPSPLSTPRRPSQQAADVSVSERASGSEPITELEGKVAMQAIAQPHKPEQVQISDPVLPAGSAHPPVPAIQQAYPSISEKVSLPEGGTVSHEPGGDTEAVPAADTPKVGRVLPGAEVQPEKAPPPVPSKTVPSQVQAATRHTRASSTVAAVVKSVSHPAPLQAESRLPKPLVGPPTYGDMKVMVKREDIKLKVMYRDYPKQGRSGDVARPRRAVQLPVLLKRSQEGVEAIVVTAKEGVYIVMAEPESSPAEADFFISLYDPGDKKMTVPKINVRIRNSTVIARILMPEGVAWDDSTAFTGSIEDTNSITKFNAETGLYWKEYKE